MKIFRDINDWQNFRKQLGNPSLGFVPTMGNLHIGHGELFARSVAENELTVVSIFINPTQFHRASDFDNYPRTLEQDLETLSEKKVDYCLIPHKQEIYNDNFQFQIQETTDSLVLEGEYRPGHFTGVLTIVMKLLQLVMPSQAYFGEKDYQQLQLIKKMVKAFFLNVSIVACPTVREANKLAYSSRNNRLTAEEKLQAHEFAKIFHSNQSIEEIKQQLKARDIVVDYIEEYERRRFAAVHIGEVRLIDNYER
jgi:pantoate--beta-alanine ligase